MPKQLSVAIFFALSLVVPQSSAALDIAGNDLILPIVARTPGAYGSQWRTDVVITNASRRMVDVPVTITFLLSDGRLFTRYATLQPRGSIALHDAVLESFGLEQAAGLLRVTSPIPNVRLTARSRIYNVGGVNGEFGQTSPGIPSSRLGRETYLSGLSGVGANRTNVGIANPSGAPADVFLSLFESDGNFRGGFATTIAPGSVTQFNDLFSHFQTGPLEDATLVVTSSTGVYAYGSIVRSDSGDADFVTGVASEIEGSVVITPSCATPAPLHLARPGYEAPGWIVIFHEGTNVATTLADLVARFAFTPTTVYEDAFPGFVAELTPETIAEIRCEPSVQLVEQNQYAVIP